VRDETHAPDQVDRLVTALARREEPPVGAGLKGSSTAVDLRAGGRRGGSLAVPPVPDGAGRISRLSSGATTTSPASGGG